ncbi:MAG: ATP-binding protein [Pseudomonadota bacterium]
MNQPPSLDARYKKAAEEIASLFAKEMNGVTPDYYIKIRPDGPYLIIEFSKPGEHHFEIHNRIASTLSDDNPFKERSTVQSRRSAPKSRLLIPETQLLKKEISESLTVDKNSLDDQFLLRYTPSVGGFETQIVANANYAVFGRRGAGKSSLLAYGMHHAIRNGHPFSWVAMQTYARRADLRVIPGVISEVLHELRSFTTAPEQFDDLIEEFSSLSESESTDTLTKCDRIIPRTRRTLSNIATTRSPLTIFLDDIHVLDETIQPIVLHYLYSLSRGNNAFIKTSGISQLTRLWDSTSHRGLQPTHDVQLITLDHNLTTPDKSKQHIVTILDAHAHYCGLPDIRYLSGDDAISRLVLVAAGVPRDSLSLFTTAITKAASKGQKLVSLTSVNAAASEMAEQKLKDIEQDSGDSSQEIQSILGEVKEFCINEQRKNAFLVEIKNADQRYRLIQKLVALRLVHVLHEGTTPHKAGKRFMALMLDYGFYVGIRAARSVELIPSEPRALLAKELRSLPIFR